MKISTLSQWVAAATVAAGDNQAEMARQVTKVLRRKIDRARINKLVDGKAHLRADEMLAIEDVSGIPIPSPNIAQKVPVIDWVAAGSLAAPASQLPIEDAQMISVADLGQGDFFALKVEGNSMDRISPHGSIVIVNRANKELVSGLPYIFSNRGETTYKLWHADPPYLDPHSWDPSHKPIFVKKRRDIETVGRVVRSILDF